ncbi:ABC transporter permease [Streptomyces sp. RerS4]|uniref:ABC transporter permease n=1 Tax=Streptomyces sp. RerS4 TaxID=2942449 RepID=UPI00201CAB55|nr:ABC transporter permease [Streptomyces sp. RerS4]UQW99677.1 ABC transporter permease [Streptomyces sp. RerS4]
MSANTSAATGRGPVDTVAQRRPRRLRGLAWLVVRQHRTALLVCAAAVVLGSAWMIYLRGEMVDSLRLAGWGPASTVPLDGDLVNRIENDLNSFASRVGSLPLLLGVFLGAPLIASDQERGTVRLVTTQSVARGRWLRWKVGFALTLAVATALPLSLFYAWWWRSAEPIGANQWLTGGPFETTGPMLVAQVLFHTALGMAIGTLIRRIVPAMAVTLVTSYAVSLVAEVYRERLGTPRRIAFPLDGPQPAFLDQVVQVDQWIGTGSGKLYGWGTCVSDASPEGCRASLGIVNSVWDFFERDQMAGMQWTGAALYLAAAAALVAGLLWRGRRAPL